MANDNVIPDGWIFDDTFHSGWKRGLENFGQYKYVDCVIPDDWSKSFVKPMV